jgi:hypothetical protein
LASEPADKPGSVPPAAARGDDHLSRMAVARHLQRPTRKSTGASNSRPACRNPFCLALLPVGDAWPVVSPRPPVRPYRTVSPSPTRVGNALLCCPVPPDHSAWLLASTALYGARTFLSCRCNCDRLANSNANTRIAEGLYAVKSTPSHSAPCQADTRLTRSIPGTKPGLHRQHYPQDPSDLQASGTRNRGPVYVRGRASESSR